MSGRLHFSDLKRIAQSPAHMAYHMRHPQEVTSEMDAGTVCHEIVLGPQVGEAPVVVYRGRRAGKAWDDFAAEHSGRRIVTASAWDDGEAMARAVLACPAARTILDGARLEVPCAWTDAGVECETRGLDILDTGRGIVAELKTTRSAEPRAFQRDAIRMRYHAQLAWLRRGAHLAGMVACDAEAYIIAVESAPPYPVTVFLLAPALVEEGERTCARWLELYRRCRENDHWPGYSDAVVGFSAPEWMGGDEP